MRLGYFGFSARRYGLPLRAIKVFKVDSPSIKAATTSPFFGSTRGSTMTTSPSNMPRNRVGVMEAEVIGDVLKTGHGTACLLAVQNEIHNLLLSFGQNGHRCINIHLLGIEASSNGWNKILPGNCAMLRQKRAE